MAKRPTKPLTRKARLEAIAAECAAKGWFFPSLDLNPPTRPHNRFSRMLNTKTGEETVRFELCDTFEQIRLVMKADKLLAESGFMDDEKAKREWLECEFNRAWFEAANPHGITSDGHLAASAAFC